ncbi:TetR/AcrR family transcriptional regulator [Amycolatopsis thermalba]|uniref:TetR/AcrR family transcriptional regulator n=1 Tax=Amycolatopsis thermalba TaxID=944492 RepID=A0ABY4NY72_9PSEU|nr:MULTISPECIES: TetR/AcrR family transcriptional regulator [Amycolatopsis]UQS25019.1 TetR/AcrR family transcriptional regulator [Amycolatopsis thermalba]
MSSSAPVRSGYHHGDLRNALIRSAAELAQAGGPSSVTIRAAARAVGVTPTAAYRHFAGHEELLEAVKTRAMELLTASVNEALDRLDPVGDPAERGLSRLAAIGRGYFAFALAEPGLFRTAFAGGLPPMPAVAESGPFGKLIEAIDDLAASGYLPPQRRPMAEFAAWASVHGLAMLHLDGPLSAAPREARELALERTIEIIAEGLGGAALTERMREELRRAVQG